MEALVGIFVAFAFPVLVAMVLIWFTLVSGLFSYLREHHPDEYEAMGRPTLFRNNSPGTSTSFLRFIQSKRPYQLNDEVLAKKCSLLRAFIYVYMFIFFGVLSTMFLAGFLAS